MLRKLGLILAGVLALAGPASAAQAIDPAALEALHQKISSGEIKGVHSVLVLQDGKTVAEWYFSGLDWKRSKLLGPVKFGPETLHDVRSVTKTVVALLVGQAVQDGAIKSLDQPVLDWFPEYADLKTPATSKITLRHLLQMGSGLHWDEDTYTYADPRNSESAMDLAADPYRYVLSQPVDAPPGSRFNYSGGDVALMAAIVTRATHMPLETYAEQRLFKPLGITSFEWLKDARGIPLAASGLRLTPREMATIGQLLLQKGKWNGRQLVPAAWVTAQTSAHIAVQPDPACGTKYGYFTWLFAGCQVTPPTPWFAAVGNGGQRIAVAPSRGVVIVMTSGLYNQPTQGRAPNAIIPGVLAATAAAH